MNARFRGWGQFSLRTTLLLMLIIGVFFGGYRLGHSKGRYERSLDPQDSFDDLIALIHTTVTPSGSPRWTINDRPSVVESAAPAEEASPGVPSDDPFAPPPNSSDAAVDPFQ